MQSRLIINLLLLLFVIVLGFYLFTSSKTPTEQQTSLMSDLDPGLIKKITIRREDKETIIIEKNDGWMITKPYTAPANPRRIDSILNLLSTQSMHQLAVEDVDLDELGLQQALITLELNEKQFKFGSTNPLDQLRYIYFDDQIHLIQDQLFYQLSSDISFFIDPKIISDSDQIIKIDNAKYRLYQENDEWLLDSKGNQIQSTANIILNSWQQIEANLVKPIEPSEPIDNINISFNNGKELTLEILSTEPELILANKHTGLQYHISQYMTDIIFPKNKVAE